MLEQFVKSVFAYFCKIEPMDVYIQEMPEGVKYPCYLLNKCDVRTEALNSFYFMNNVHLYIRCFGRDEITLKNTVSKLVNTVFAEHRKIPILDKDGLQTERYIRLEGIETIEITVNENDVYCLEINFNFDTTHVVNVEEFSKLGQVFADVETRQ